MKSRVFRQSLIALTLAPSLAVGAGCPTDLNAVCRVNDGPTAFWSGGGCIYGQCFEMSYGEAGRAHTMGDETLFPRQFFVWTPGAPTAPTGVGVIPCEIQKNGNKWRVEIPTGNNRCKVQVTVGEQVYFEHFVSNPATSCLAWLECKLSPP